MQAVKAFLEEYIDALNARDGARIADPYYRDGCRGWNWEMRREDHLA